MISANDILRIALSTEDMGKVKLLWHLHSFTVEIGGPARFLRELQEWFPESLDAFLAGGGGDVLGQAFGFLQEDGYGFRSGRQLRGLLYGHMERSEKETRENFYRTNIGRSVWDTLDWCLAEQRPCFIEGFEGRGKSATAKAWCEAHRGQARYASLDGFANQRDFFSALAEPYGVPYLNINGPHQIRYRLQDVVVRSGLMLVIDEAHFAIDQKAKNGRPVIIDWIDSALCNHNIPTALVSTPQFGRYLAECEKRTGWNARQFRRRFSGRWTRLDQNTTKPELLALAERLLPAAGKKGAAIAAEFAVGFSRDVVKVNPNGDEEKLPADVSGLIDLVKDANSRARKSGHASPTFQDVLDAYTLDRIPNENAMAAAFSGTKRPNAKKEPIQPAAATTPQPAGSRAATSPTILMSGARRDQIETVNHVNQ